MLERKCAKKRPELWCNHNWLLHHNTPTHTSLKTTEFVTNSNMVIVPHPPYLPDSAPCDFALFLKLKTKLEGRRFETSVLTSKGNCKQYSTGLRKMTSTVLLKHGKNDGIAMYIPKETILKEMAAKIE
jgi:hypothetical protein